MNKILYIAVLALLLQLAPAMNLVTYTPNDDKVKVDFYFESLCPYCQQYIVGSLKKAAATKVPFFIFRISGRSVISISIPMVMQEGLKMARVGVSLANMVQDNVREI